MLVLLGGFLLLEKKKERWRKKFASLFILLLDDFFFFFSTRYGDISFQETVEKKEFPSVLSARLRKELWLHKV